MSSACLHMPASLSAPRILAQDAEAGLLLLEDLGEDSYTRLLREEGAREEALYLAAMDALIALQRAAPPRDWPAYDAALLRRELALFAEWFLPALAGAEEGARLGAEYRALWEGLLARLPAPTGQRNH